MSATLSVFTLYRDPSGAVAWLVRAFGFDVVNRVESEPGIVQHAELRLGDAVVLVQAASDGHEPPRTAGGSSSRAPVLSLGDEHAVDELFERAVSAGATVLVEPETTPWGNHRFEVLDPEGFQWSVGSYQPGEPMQATS
jgi:uncharacterized glyoxalase superfamily protein PhnB